MRNIFTVLALFIAVFSASGQIHKADTIHLNKTSGSPQGFELLDSIVSNYTVFITGENHTYLESNSKLWVEHFKYLHQHAGVRNIMIEYGFASGWLINEYIQTGDSSLLDILKDYSFKQYSDAYQALYEFNKELDSADKIYLVGIDLERGVYSASKVLSLQLPSGVEPPDSIALDIESLKSLVSYNDNELFDADNTFDMMKSYSVRNTLDRVLSNFNKHPTLYKEYLGEKYALFERILKGFSDLKVWKEYEDDNSTHQFVYREKYMFDRFKEEYSSRGGKFFGQFGRCHSAKATQEQTSCNWYHFKSLANRIEESPQLNLKQKVMTLGILYKNESYDDDGWEKLGEHIKQLFTEMPSDRLLLYNLPKDSFLFDGLKDYFDFVIFNTTKPTREHPYVDPYEFDFEYGEKNNTKVLVYMGALYVDMFEVNDLMVEYNNPYDNRLILIGGEIVTTNDAEDWIMSNFSFGWILNQERKYENVTSNLSGFVINSSTLFNLTNKVKWLDVMPGLGFGYSRLKLSFTEESYTDPIDVRHGFIGNAKYTEYSNPAMTFNLLSEIDFNFSAFTIGATGGYQFDMSKKNWVAKELLSNGPKTSLTGPYVQIHIGATF
jgi:hypothetical protein